jgi:hypothetical protein
MPNAMYKKPFESKVVLKLKVRLICLFESNSNNIKLKKKIKKPNEIGITESLLVNLTASVLKKYDITPKMPLNKMMNDSGNDLFSGPDVDKDSI